MSMATRCVACGTIFRVVQDQLKVSEGWVRCGRCDEVFNAQEGLFDLDRDTPPPWQPGTAPTNPRTESGFERTAADLDEDDRIASRFFQPEQEDVEQTPAEAVSRRDRVDFADAQFNTDLLTEDEGGAEPVPAAATAAREELPDDDAPAFVRHADRQARWRTPRVRLLLSLAGLLLVGTLTLQAGHHFRDSVAAMWPALHPALAGWCRLADCRIDAPRRINDLTVESSALTRASAGNDAFKLMVTLRNRGAWPVRLPSIDLSLTDTDGQLVARRALGPVDFHAQSTTLAPGAEAALQTLLTAGTPRVAGYTVEVFYP